MGLMPHPEHAVDPLTGSADGLELFASAAAAARSPPPPDAGDHLRRTDAICSLSATLWIGCVALILRPGTSLSHASASLLQTTSRQPVRTRAGRPLRGRRRPLGHDAAAADARRPPQMAIPPETHFVPPADPRVPRLRFTPEGVVEAAVDDRNRRWGDIGIDDERDARAPRARIEPLNAPDAIRAFYGLYAERRARSRWGDKTPDYVKRIAEIGRVLPEARFVHLIRDGRDVALSLNAGWSRARRQGARARTRPRPPLAKRDRAGPRCTRSASAGGYLEVRYEDLVLDTEPTLRRVCEFVELDWDPVMLDYHERAAERLTEIARDLPAREGKPARPGEERLQAHALTREPPQAQPDRRLARADEPAGAKRVRERRRRPAGRARLPVGEAAAADASAPATAGNRDEPAPRRLSNLFGRATYRPPFPFVVGMNRSGTTLLRMMLDAHPELTIPPETHFVPGPDQGLPGARRDARGRARRR